MNSRDIQSYQEVHTIDEGIRSSLKRFLGRKKKEAEAPKPMSRGEVLRQRYNVGPEKSDTSAKRQILNRSRARAERDEEKYGGSIYTKKVADKSREAHNRYLKAGYSKYGATHTAGSAPEQGRGNKARKRAAALNKEEFDFILYHLVNEGYTNNLESAEVIASNMSEEWRDDIMERKYDENENLPGSGLTPKQKYRRKRKQFLKKSTDKFTGSTPQYRHPDDFTETGRQRAQRMSANYGYGSSR